MRKSLYTPGQRKIAQTIREMRIAAHLTQRALATRLKRPLNVISRIESAQRRVDLLEWIAICEACQVDPVHGGTALLKTLHLGA